MQGAVFGRVSAAGDDSADAYRFASASRGHGKKVTAVYARPERKRAGCPLFRPSINLSGFPLISTVAGQQGGGR